MENCFSTILLASKIVIWEIFIWFGHKAIMRNYAFDVIMKRYGLLDIYIAFSLENALNLLIKKMWDYKTLS